MAVFKFKVTHRKNKAQPMVVEIEAESVVDASVEVVPHYVKANGLPECQIGSSRSRYYSQFSIEQL